MTLVAALYVARIGVREHEPRGGRGNVANSNGGGFSRRGLTGTLGLAFLFSPITWAEFNAPAGSTFSLGDTDSDGDVDSADFAEFQLCLDLGGPHNSFPAECESQDVEPDEDLDLQDLATFLNAFTGTRLAAMVHIPGGDFLMGDALGDGTLRETPRHWARVGSFFMDRFEVTNTQYADALNWANDQGRHITVINGLVYQPEKGTQIPYFETAIGSSFSGVDWDGDRFHVVPGREDHPVVLVTWYGAAAYANWRSAMEQRVPLYDTRDWSCDFSPGGYRLPTEAEWEYAARGGVAGMRFPWSDSQEVQHARANYFSYAAYPYDTSPTRRYHPTFDTGDHPLTNPVGYFAPNHFGLLDMAGNAMEWCNDWYLLTYYSISPFPDPPTGPTTGTSRVLRGGSWTDNAINLRCSARMYTTPDNRVDIFGFRLVVVGE